MRFLVATYGAKHIGMLLAHLHAIRRTHPQAQIEVYHQDLPARRLDALMQAHPEVVWNQTRFDFTNDRIQRISSKTLAWEYAIQRQADGETVCLLDVDTLVVRDVQPFFSDAECDVIFTYKTGGFVLNTGVLLCRINARTRAFFAEWRRQTIAILQDPERYRKANSPDLPYGAGDQMALHEMLGYREGTTAYEMQLGDEKVRLRGESCEYLNETRSCPITERTHIIHFKGGWQPILLEGRSFSKNRPKAGCWEMYLFYLDTFEQALAHVNSRTSDQSVAADWGVSIPSYVRENDGARRSLRYALFVTGNHLRSVVEFWIAGCRFLARKTGILQKTA
jgi:hypothetical protein